MTDDTARQRAFGLIRRYGWNSISFQTLEPHFQYWFSETCDAMVAYYQVGATWVAAGDPVCAERDLAEAVAGFVASARRMGKRVCFFGITDRLASLLSTSAQVVKVGEQPWWDPQRWHLSGALRRTVRAQVRRAERQHVHVYSVDPEALEDPSSEVRRGAEHVIESWLSQRRMANMGYVVHLEPFAFAGERRYLMARRTAAGSADAAVGFLSAVPIYARNGWLVEDLLRGANAPNGTMEMLIDAAMRRLAAEHAEYATLGLVPLRNTAATDYPAPGWLEFIFRQSIRFLHPLYNFEGQQAFKAKHRPDGWENIYIAGVSGFRPMMLLAILLAFTDNRPVRFALVSAGRLCRAYLQRVTPRQWRMASLAFASTLVVWIGVLAMSPEIHWFGQQWLRIGWIIFDVLMVGVFLMVAHGAQRRARWVADVSAVALGAVSTDWILTLVHAAAYYHSSSRGIVETLVPLTAISGPTLAIIFFLGLYLVSKKK